MIATRDMTMSATTPEAPEDLSPEALARRVDEARSAAETLGEDARKALTRHAEAFEAFHARALKTIVARLKADPRGKELLFELVDDPIVYASMLALGVVRPDLTTRVARAIERVRPYARSHGGDLELVRVEGSTVFVRLHGSCSGCSMSAQTLADGVEKAVRAAAPEIDRVEQVHDRPVAGFVPLTVAGGGNDWRREGWVKGPAADEVQQGRARRMLNDGCDVLLLRRDERLFAYRNACPHQGMPLDDGDISPEGVLTCPWHGLSFEVCGGECLNEPSVQLDPLPLRVHDGFIWVRAAGAGEKPAP